MPGMYAHYRFGRQVLGAFSPRQRQSIGRFRRLYEMGLYGPDIFDYYNPLAQTQVGDLEARYHSQTGRECFTAALAAATSEGAQAYLWGLLTHYCLDAAWDDALQKLTRQGLRRETLEAEFDAYLLELDGLDPRYDRSRHMALTRGECVTVSQFYPPATAAQTHGAIGRMRWFYHFLANPNEKRVGRWMGLLKSSPLYHRQVPQALTQDQRHRCSTLLTRYTRAVKQFPTLPESLTQSPLPEIFNPPFRGEEGKG